MGQEFESRSLGCFRSGPSDDEFPSRLVREGLTSGESNLYLMHIGLNYLLGLSVRTNSPPNYFFLILITSTNKPSSPSLSFHNTFLSLNLLACCCCCSCS
ncbi:hypothetical protein QVD17_17545 [Tagetes erecta]|uniref:Uncharacterized protein n=1 Tax=Tagetes erecta TaxID=13708 RepID=A0AAD8KX25_TARER|nr:hypothetical protein QVD17_17545 [Tagetes erecta]